MKYIFYIGDFKSGIMDAQCQLVLGNAKIFRDLGYTVVLIGNDSSLSGQDLLTSKTQVDGFDFYNIRFSKSIKDLLYTRNFHQEIIKVLQAYPKPDAVVLYGSLSFAVENYKLCGWCRKNGVRVVSNCVDLSSQAHGTKVQRFVKSIDRELKDRFVCTKADGVIAVSSYIKDYFSQKNKGPMIVVPPLKDTLCFPEPKLSEDPIAHLVYIGVPFPTDGRAVDESAYKDRIDLFIGLLCGVRNRAAACCLDIYGLTKEQYLNIIKGHTALLNENSDIIRFHGRVKHEEAMNAVSCADFSVLYRTKNQMTMAGFSSKLVESVSCGTPVILTDTSDYKDYITEGKTGCFLSPGDDEKLVSTLSMKRNKINKMKKECYNSRVFDYTNYKLQMKAFLEAVLKK